MCTCTVVELEKKLYYKNECGDEFFSLVTASFQSGV